MVVVNGASKGATRTTMFGQPAYPGYSGSSGVAHAQPPPGGAPNYSATQLAQMYNNANAESTNPQNVNYGVSSSGHLQLHSRMLEEFGVNNPDYIMNCIMPSIDLLYKYFHLLLLFLLG